MPWCRPWAPSIPATRDFFINMDIEPYMGLVLQVPQEISISMRPREVDDTWWKHSNKFEDYEPIIEAPWAQGADTLITQQYARWARSAESFLVSTFPGGSDDQSFLGRGSCIQFKQVANVLTTRKEHIFAAPPMSFWDRFSNMLRTKGAVLARLGKDETMEGSRDRGQPPMGPRGGGDEGQGQ